MPHVRHVQRCIFLLVVVATFILLLPVSTADATTDAERSAVGSITLLLTESTGSSASPMEGGQIALYRVATVDVSTGRMYNVLAGQFASSASVEKIPTMTKKELDDRNFRIASSLQAELTEQDVKPLQTVDVADGKASFSAVEEGLYLIVQAAPSRGGQSMGAFLMSVPGDAGELDVVCQPKPGVLDHGGKKGGSTAETTAGGKAGSQASTTSPSSIGLRVPATGDRATAGLPWAIGGVVLIPAGVVARRCQRRFERAS